MKPLRPAFTIIEILVSVLILSVSIIYILQIHSSNHEQIVYISERNKYTLEDSLYLDSDMMKYHKASKSAYDLLAKEFKIKEFQSRDILKKTEREFFIHEEIYIIPPSDVPGPTALAKEITLKGEYSSNYWHFEIQGL
ncbi:hypothetical protein [Sulfurovum sp.]|uniref:type IV pilus modification PilV family protein n=1 Tax=Sulfurovum sp. TaxID=1969726 RepID=UPI00286800D6|nr:hypothetical protein [Sulfurovum sp.]